MNFLHLFDCVNLFLQNFVYFYDKMDEFFTTKIQLAFFEAFFHAFFKSNNINWRRLSLNKYKELMFDVNKQMRVEIEKISLPFTSFILKRSLNILCVHFFHCFLLTFSNLASIPSRIHSLFCPFFVCLLFMHDNTICD